MIPVYKPYLNKEILKYAHDALDSTWISSNGIYLDKAKEKLKEITAAKYVILVNNGTAATHLVALGLKYKYPNVNKLIVPNNVYVAAWNSFLFSGGYELFPKDANPSTWNFDLSKLNSIDTNTAILVVHNLGNIINVPLLRRKFPEVIFVEDNCEGFLGKYEGKFSGSESLISSVSFFGNKTITSGEGGAVFTNDESLFEYLNSVKGQGQSSRRYLHDKLGYNYRMTNIQAALLLGQLEVLSIIQEKKAEIFYNYQNELKDLEKVSFQKMEANTSHAQWMFALRLIDFTIHEKEKLELFLYENQIETRPMFYPITSHQHLSNIDCDVTNAKILHNQVILLPSYPELTKNQIKFICEKIKKFKMNKNK